MITIHFFVNGVRLNSRSGRRFRALVRESR